MVYLIKLLFLVYMTVLYALSEALGYDKLLMLLLIAFINIIMEKYIKSLPVMLITIALIVFGITLDGYFAILLCLPALDFMYHKIYYGAAIAGVYCLYNAYVLNYPHLIPLALLCAALAYKLESSKNRESVYIKSLDEERKLRYELEQVKDKLLNSSKDVAYLAEVRERNRIAREIHDNIGHSIAGILIQLQVARKLCDDDINKSREMLDKSIAGLSDSLTVLRNTVHNIKPKEDIGVPYIKNIIENFSFCPVDFKFTGDFSTLSPRHTEIIGANIKEALTNASKYSGASKIVISLSLNERYVRLFIKDNGKGCSRIKEGLGLSGMRDRVENMGGSISISSEDGFLIVCLLPFKYKEGDEEYEGTNS